MAMVTWTNTGVRGWPKNVQLGKKSSSTRTRALLHACVFLLAIAPASAFGFGKKAKGGTKRPTSLSQPYVKMAGSQCLGAAIKNTFFSKLKRAQEKCDALGLGCAGVYDVACDRVRPGVGKGKFYLCKDGITFGKSVEKEAGKTASCVYTKHTQCGLQHGSLHPDTDPIRADVWRLSASAIAHIKGHVNAKLTTNLDFHRLCVAIMERFHNAGGACGGKFVLRHTLITPKYEAAIIRKEVGTKKRRSGSQDVNTYVTFTCKKDLPDVYSVLDLCTAPCMDETQNTGKCCIVPVEAAGNFACCREAGCCFDQLPTGHKRRRRARGVRVRHPRKMPGVEVTAGVEVEESASSRSTFDQLMSCLRQPGKTPLACNMDAPWVVAADAPTGAPTTPATTG